MNNGTSQKSEEKLKTFFKANESGSITSQNFRM
jgi:hypothetical protein